MDDWRLISRDTNHHPVTRNARLRNDVHLYTTPKPNRRYLTAECKHGFCVIIHSPKSIVVPVGTRPGSLPRVGQTRVAVVAA